MDNIDGDWYRVNFIHKKGEQRHEKINDDNDGIGNIKWLWK